MPLLCPEEPGIRDDLPIGGDDQAGNSSARNASIELEGDETKSPKAKSRTAGVGGMPDPHGRQLLAPGVSL